MGNGFRWDKAQREKRAEREIVAAREHMDVLSDAARRAQNFADREWLEKLLNHPGMAGIAEAMREGMEKQLLASIEWLQVNEDRSLVDGFRMKFERYEFVLERRASGKPTREASPEYSRLRIARSQLAKQAAEERRAKVAASSPWMNPAALPKRPPGR